MMIFKTIDNIFKISKYGIWIMALLGLPCSTVLMVYNIPNGFTSVIVCFSALLLSMALILILLPLKFVKRDIFDMKRYIVGIILSIFSLVLFGLVYFSLGTFPKLNLIFN